MKRTERRYEFVVSAAVAAVFAAFWVIVFAMGDPPEFQSQYVFSALMVAVVATLWVIAVRLLWRAWWARYTRPVTPACESLRTGAGWWKAVVMRVVIAPDKFKGAISARQAAEAIGRGIRREIKDFCRIIPGDVRRDIRSSVRHLEVVHHVSDSAFDGLDFALSEGGQCEQAHLISHSYANMSGSTPEKCTFARRSLTAHTSGSECKGIIST